VETVFTGGHGGIGVCFAYFLELFRVFPGTTSFFRLLTLIRSVFFPIIIALIEYGFYMLSGQAFPGYVSSNQCCVNRNRFAADQSRFVAGFYGFLKDFQKPFYTPSLSDPGQGALVGAFIRQVISRKPPYGNIDFRFPDEFPVVDNALNESRQHEANSGFRLNPRTPVGEIVAVGNFFPQPAQIQNLVYLFQDVVFGDVIDQGTRNE